MLNSWRTKAAPYSVLNPQYLTGIQHMGETWGIIFEELVFYTSALAQHKEQDTPTGLHDISSTGQPVQRTGSPALTATPHLRPKLMSKSPVIRLSKMYLQPQDLLSNLSPTILSALPPSLKESSLFLQPHFQIKDSHQVTTVLQISHLLLGHFAKLFMTLPPQETPSLSPSKAVHQLCGIPSSKGHLFIPYNWLLSLEASGSLVIKILSKDLSFFF